MKIAVVNSVAGISSKELAAFLTDGENKATPFKPNKIGRYDFRDHDVVFNYGYGGHILYNRVVNTPDAVLRCVDKPTSFACFQKAGVNTVEHVTRREAIPKKWEWVVVRNERAGRKAEGLAYHENIPGKIPEGELYSEYFEHKYEYRVVVFMGKVVGFYYKSEDDEGMWHFLIQPKKGFEKMGEQCIAAAKALGIDYVGFDVVANTKTDFKILEANSAPILTAESMEAIWAHFYS